MEREDVVEGEEGEEQEVVVMEKGLVRKGEPAAAVSARGLCGLLARGLWLPTLSSVSGFVSGVGEGWGLPPPPPPPPLASPSWLSPRRLLEWERCGRLWRWLVKGDVHFSLLMGTPMASHRALSSAKAPLASCKDTCRGANTKSVQN